MPTSAKKIQETYCNELCETGKRPITVLAFCKGMKISEETFYKHYASFQALESSVFESFFENTLSLLEKDENYQAADAHNKLLSFYYTFFEVMLANRTLVHFLLPEDNKKWLNANVLKKLKHHFQNYIDSLGIEFNILNNTPFSSYQEKGIRSVAWLQLLKTIDFWSKDESKGFEKTDIYIEKSLRASFDLIQKNPFESLIDFGKFIYKETVQK